jgi:hypothetical protein
MSPMNEGFEIWYGARPWTYANIMYEILFKLAVVNVATVLIFEVIFDKFTVDNLYWSNMFLQLLSYWALSIVLYSI